MRQRDLQQALLRGASINDTAFATLVQAGLGVSGWVAIFCFGILGQASLGFRFSAFAITGIQACLACGVLDFALWCSASPHPQEDFHF